jgi:hypothetical protein
MAWWDTLKKALAPRENRAGAAGLRTTTVPNLAAPIPLQGGAAYTYGNLGELLADGGSGDNWVESIHLCSPDTGNKNMMVALTLEAGAGACTPSKIEREVSFHTNTTVPADFHETIPITPPLFLPAGTGLRAACADDAGAKKISIWANLSKGKS